MNNILSSNAGLPLIANTYKLLNIIGSGAYGTVYAAIDAHGKLVAIKQIFPFDKDQSNIYLRRCLREIRVLKFLRQQEHPHIIRLFRAFQETTPDGIQRINLVMEKMDCDLHRVIRLQSLSNDHVRFFTYQLLSGLAFLHQCRLIHRDLKPSNLFVNANCDLKIGDFGLTRMESCFEEPSSSATPPSSSSSSSSSTSPSNGRSRKFTDYVQTRWYRAPETILGNHYSKAVDLWSVGCIIAEMILRVPLMAGRNTVEQLLLSLEYSNHPSLDVLECKNISNAKIRNALIDRVCLQPSRGKKSIKDYVKENQISIEGEYPDTVWEMIESLLRFNPDERMDVNGALCHDYMESTTSLDALRMKKMDISSDDGDSISDVDLKNMLLMEMETPK